MKTIKKQTILVLSATFIMMIGCTNKNEDSVSTDETNATVTQGNWKVSYFYDSDSDETQKFSGYTFTFGISGSLTATSSSDTRSGTWSTGSDDSKVKIYITFPGSAPFDEISDDWHMIEQNSSIIKLEDVSGGNGGTDYLHFSKL